MNQDVLTVLNNGLLRLYRDIDLINSQLEVFKGAQRALNRRDINAVRDTRRDLSQILTDVSVLLSSITAMKRQVNQLISNHDTFALIPKKKAALEELDGFHGNYRMVLYGLKEVSQEIRDCQMNLLDLEKSELGNVD